MRLVVPALLALAALLSGCGNSCQSLCVTMAEYSRECGNTVSESEIEVCINSFASVEPEERQACQDFGTPDLVRREWTCEDINLFR